MAVYKSKTPTKDGRQWFFKVYKKDFNGNNKAHKSKKYFTKKEALEEEALFIMKRDNPISKPFALIAKGYFAEMYKKRKESTVYCYENAYNVNIKPYFEHFNIKDINISTIKNWRLEMEKKGLKLNYLNKLYVILKSIFNYAIVNYGLGINIVQQIGPFESKNEEIKKDSEKIRYITLEEFNKFISVIDNSMYKTLFMFLYYTGMRKGEVQALTWNDIDFNNSEIIVNKTLSTKTKEEFKITSTKNNQNRKVKMNNLLYNQLVEYKNEISKYSDFKEKWFVFGNTRFLPDTTITRYKNYYFKLSGVKAITIHEFRHSHVSLLINEYIKNSKEKNVKIDTAKFFLIMSNRMGHTINVMQTTYMHLFPTIQDEIIDILNNL